MRFSANPHGESAANSTPDEASIRAQLERILASELFQHSRRYPALLRHVVEQTTIGAADELKERTLGITVFRRNPEYDTSADPVVRTTASEIRKRLEAYYSEPGHGGELRIVLPVGTYVPEFRLPPDREGLQSSSHSIAGHSVTTVRPRRWRVWGVAALLLMVVGIGVAIRIGSAGNALHRFWEPVLRPSSPVPLVMETLMARRPITQAAAAVSPAVEEVLDPNLFLIVNEGNSRIAAYFGANGRTLEYDLARNVTLAKLRARPFILKGAFNNPLTRQAVSSLKYSLYLDRTALVRQIVDRENPARHWDSPMAELSKDYALIARAPEPRTGQTMVVIAGLGERGGAAATEFLTNPKYMDGFAAQAPRGWEKRNLEIVIETGLVNGDWGEPRIVATHVW